MYAWYHCIIFCLTTLRFAWQPNWFNYEGITQEAIRPIFYPNLLLYRHLSHDADHPQTFHKWLNGNVWWFFFKCLIIHSKTSDMLSDDKKKTFYEPWYPQNFKSYTCYKSSFLATLEEILCITQNWPIMLKKTFVTFSNPIENLSPCITFSFIFLSRKNFKTASWIKCSGWPIRKRTPFKSTCPLFDTSWMNSSFTTTHLAPNLSFCSAIMAFKGLTTTTIPGESFVYGSICIITVFPYPVGKIAIISPFMAANTLSTCFGFKLWYIVPSPILVWAKICLCFHISASFAPVGMAMLLLHSRAMLNPQTRILKTRVKFKAEIGVYRSLTKWGRGTSLRKRYLSTD